MKRLLSPGCRDRRAAQPLPPVRAPYDSTALQKKLLDRAGCRRGCCRSMEPARPPAQAPARTHSNSYPLHALRPPFTPPHPPARARARAPASWCGCNNSAIFADLVPEQLRSTIYAYDRRWGRGVGAGGWG